MIYKTSSWLVGYCLVYAWRQNMFTDKESIYYNKDAHKQRFTHVYQSISWPMFVLPMAIDLFISFEQKMNKYLE